uniref:Isoprene synthase, chloroplastic n=1 Tax=Salix viminalis TaxID=40686 RepID=A0A6N2MD43_SALVM
MAMQAHFTSNTLQRFSPFSSLSSSMTQISPSASFRFAPPKTRRTTLRAHAAPASQPEDTSRPLANFPLSVWGDRFVNMPLDDSSDIEALCVQIFKSNSIKVEEEDVRKLLVAETDDSVEKIDFINTLCRLGVSYHFESDIEEQIHKIFVTEPDLLDKNDYDLHTVALVFRVFRQHGYKICCDVFDKFKENDGKFKESLDAKGLLSLYEAAYLSTPGDDILDEALAFTKVQLEQSLAAESMSSHLHKQIINALKQCLHRGIPRIEARKYIDIYEGEEYRNEMLLEFAKLDYNRVQFIYQRELKDISKWKDTNLEKEYTYARSRIVEAYVWQVIFHSEPHYARARMMHGKVIAFLAMIDDTYDAYGTKEEHRCFTDAIDRWNYGALDQLPDYLKKLYKVLLDTFSEFENDLAPEGRSYSVHYVKEEMKVLVRGFHNEQNWLHEGHVPSMEEYFSYALTSCGVNVIAAVSFMGMGQIARIQDFEWIQKKPRILRAASIIGRLTDDLVTHKDEQTRAHVASSVECYMKEHGVSERKAVAELRKKIENAWKEINQECMKPAQVPPNLLARMLNIVRLVNVLYKDVDTFTNSEHLKTFVTQLLIDPIPL